MDGPKVLSKSLKQQRRRVVWPDAIRVKAKLGSTRAKVELLDGDAGLFSSSETLIGEETIYNLRPGMNNWLHFYGGAIAATNEDVSLAMIKGGAVGPASTYRGSLCVHFSTRAKAPASLWPPHVPQLRGYSRAQLVVKMYRGLYLQELAPPVGEPPRKCTLYLQVPSASLPVRLTASQVARLPAYNRLQDPELRVIKPTNPNILAFPGEITDGGMLNFLVGDEERQLAKLRTGGCLGMCKRIELPEDEEDDPTRPLFYVERKSLPFPILPNVDRCFMYLQIDEMPEEPPRVFGVMHLLERSTDPLKSEETMASSGGAVAKRDPIGELKRKSEADARKKLQETQDQQRSVPVWERLRWDLSVFTPPDAAVFETGIVGRVLCSARLSEDIPEDDWEELDDLEMNVKPPSNKSVGPEEKLADEDEDRPNSVRSRQQKPQALEILPKTLAKTGAWCGPAMEQLRVGSLGTAVKFKRKASSDMYVVYCHVDVLCARDLPAMDENGLCDPTWIVQVQNKQQVSLQVPPSLNPTYVQRVVIPYEVYIPPVYGHHGEVLRKRVGNVNGFLQLEADPNNPLPPVRLIVRDRDVGNPLLFVPDEFQEIATIANLRPQNLDANSLKLAKNTRGASTYDGRVRLDEAHVPVWQRMDAQEDGLTFEQNDRQKGRQGKPLVLWAAGYSLQPGSHLMFKTWRYEGPVVGKGTSALVDEEQIVRGEGMVPEREIEVGEEIEFEYMLNGCGKVAGVNQWITNFAPDMKSWVFVEGQERNLDPTPVFKINTGEFKYYRPTLDLLGIRRVSPDIKYGLNLRIRSFWRNPLDIELDDSELPTINIKGVVPPQKEWEALAEKVKSIMRLVPTRDDENAGGGGDRKSQASINSPGRSSLGGSSADVELASSVATDVGVDEFLGVRVVCPVYRAPLIPYLQAAWLSTQKHKHTKTRVASQKLANEIRGGKAGTKGGQAVNLDSPEEMKFALLPSVAFMLQSSIGLGDFGALSLPLQEYARPGRSQGAWFENVAARMEGMPPAYQGLAPMKHVTSDPVATVVYIDVFSEQEGSLWWDNDARMGRNIRSQSLFRVNDHMQFLNPADYFLNNMQLLDDEFTQSPILYADRKNTTVYPDGKDVVTMCLQPFYDWAERGSPQVVELYLSNKAFWETELTMFRRDWTVMVPKMVGVNKGQASHMVRKVFFWNTGRLSRMMRAFGWRYKSRYHRPTHIQLVVHGKTKNLIMPPDEQKQPGEDEDSEEEALEAELSGETVEEKAELRSQVDPRSKGTKQAVANLEYMRKKEGKSLAEVDAEREKFHQWTFLRPVGHIITEHDRDSKVLARFRMIHLMDEPLDGYHEDYAAEVEEKDETLRHAILGECLSSADEGVSPADAGGDGGAGSGRRKDDRGAAVAGGGGSGGDSRRPSKGVSSPSAGAKNKSKQMYPRYSNNFVTVKYGLRSTDGRRILRAQVVWAPPKERHLFAEPGEILFVLKLLEGENEGNYIQIVAPGFDLRFPYETSYYVRKTLMERWRTLERQIAETTKKIKDAGDQTSHQPKKKKKQTKNEEVDLEPNGFSVSIPVRSNEFVVRLFRRYGASIFDREQTESWYRKYLGDVFEPVFKDALAQEVEEVQSKSGMTTDKWKHRFQMDSMNIRKDLVVGESMDFVGELKGHVTLEDIPASKLDMVPEGADFFETIPQPLPIPLNRFWQTDTMMVHIYVLTARNLINSGGVGTVCPYLTATAGATTVVSEKRSAEATNNPDFYEHFEVPLQIPGTDAVTISVMNQGTISDTKIGQIDVDIEDRWQAVLQKELTEVTTLKWLQRHLSEEGVDPEDGDRIPSSVAPGKPFPIEFGQLSHIDPESSLKTPAGSIRYWVDLVPTEENYQNCEIAAAKAAACFEIRCTVWNVKGVSIFKDDGQRNDLIVRGTLIVRSIAGEVTRYTKETDCHKLCNADGNFNWRWKYDVDCPAASASLVLQLLDSDALSDSEPLYDPEVVPLDHHLRLAYTNFRDKPGEVLGERRVHVVFDSWPADAPKPVSVSCCPCCNRTRNPTPATLMADIHVVPKVWANANPVGEGREGPKPLPDPEGRVSWQSALKNPVMLMKLLLGPQKVVYCRWLCGCTFFTTLALSVFGILFLVSQTAGSSGLGVIDR
ncbi:unnamed protein product [Amoebophrya sp. A25]|nr:unnamed protein product [Amoebophrya sp. A25]|eukprot:GSA25T00016796001.1